MSLRKVPKKFQRYFRPAKTQRAPGHGAICQICRFHNTETECCVNQKYSQIPNLTIYTVDGSNEIFRKLRMKLPIYYGSDFIEMCNFYRQTFKAFWYKIMYLFHSFPHRYELRMIYIRICPSRIRHFFTEIEGIRLNCRNKIQRLIFLYIHRPPMELCPEQPRPGDGYLCDACIYEGQLEGTTLATCCSQQVKERNQAHPWLIALTPAGDEFSLMQLYYVDEQSPYPVFGKDYTERCSYFEQNWANDDFAGLDLIREAHKPFNYELLKQKLFRSRR